MELSIHQDVKELLDELNEIGESKIFGGYLRDLILEKIPSDVDIATKIPIEIIEKKFSHMEKASRRTTISGHDVYSFKMHRKEKIFVEIVYTQGDILHKSYEADFTINSLLHDGKKLIDQNNALQDFQQKIIREVDIDIIRKDLKERPYLWLKTIRLASVTGYSISEKVFQALNENKNYVSKIINGVLQTEGHKTVNGVNPFKAMEYLAKMGFIASFDERTILNRLNLPIQTPQMLCLLAIKSSKQTMDDFIHFYCFPKKLEKKYEELYQAYFQKEKIPSKIRNQVCTIKKIIKKDE